MAAIQFYLTPAAGKRLIAQGVAAHSEVQAALRKGTVVVVAGTTGGFLAQELLRAVGREEGFDPRHFYRGVVRPVNAVPALSPRNEDVVIRDGVWQRGMSIFDAAADLRAGDVILKGANAVDLAAGEAAVFIGSPVGGTIAAASAAAVGRHVRLLLPVGVEKRVGEPLRELCALCNAPDTQGLGLWLAPGQAFTELDAIRLLTGARAHLFGAGGVCGAEGGAYFLAEGTPEQLEKVQQVIGPLQDTPPVTLE